MSPPERLSPRHLEALQALAEGLEVKDVAARLGVSKFYVWDLCQSARHVLGATTTTQAVALAISLGLVDVEHGQGGRLRRAREHLRAAAALLDT